MAERKTTRVSGTVREDEALKLISLGYVHGYSVAARDGELGTIDEFLFDDEIWAVRYVVIKTGDWLPGKKVLISPFTLEAPDWELTKLSVSLTMDQVRTGPLLGADEQVSRLHQIELYRHYGWVPYWVEEEYYDVPPHPSRVISNQSPEDERAADPHLFGTRETAEYRVEALNGDAGHIEDFIMDEDDWVIHYIANALEDPLPEEESSKLVLISIEWVQKVVRNEERIYVDLDRARIRSSPVFDPAVPIDREYELELYDHYGRPRYWDQGGDTEEEEDTRFSS